MFGTNQSMLEALTLKSHLMGPGWLTVRRPRRVAAEKQVCSGLSGRWWLHGCVHACITWDGGWRLGAPAGVVLCLRRALMLLPVAPQTCTLPGCVPVPVSNPPHGVCHPRS
jgi:hypothetical protein